MPVELPIPPEQLAVYRATARQRLTRQLPQVTRRRQQAWELARQVATLLRERFGATRVVVFGSLVHEDCFTPWSDVDLAAWDLRPQDTFQALGAVLDLDTPITVDLVDIHTCRPTLRALIEQEGVEV